MSYVVGIDIGTQGTKAALFALDGGCLADAFVASKLLRPKPGVVEENAEDQLSAVCKAIKQCVKQAKIDPTQVVAVGIAGQMAGVIGVDKQGQAVTPYDSWLDQRCSPQIEEMNQKAGDEILRLTGGPASFNHGPKKLWWKQQRKAAYRRIAKFVQPGGYVAMRLCGLDARGAFIDGTYLHFSGFADNRRKRWDAGLCDAFEIDQSKLPRIVDPHDVVGQLSAAGARRCGLHAGTPVVAGCGDTAGCFLACGATKPGICVDVAGTASVFAATADRFKPDRKHGLLNCARSAMPGLWHAYASITGGGMNLEWFRKQSAVANSSASKGMSLQRLDELASRRETPQGLPLFVPHLGGRVSPPQPELRGAWVGLDWSHELSDLYRGVLEGVALEYAVYHRVVASLYKKTPMTSLHVTGGGRTSKLWNKIKADVLQMRLSPVDVPEGAARGAAMIAAVGGGAFDKLEDASAAWVAKSQPVRPVKKMARYYKPRLAAYEKALAALDGLTAGA